MVPGRRNVFIAVVQGSPFANGVGVSPHASKELFRFHQGVKH
jgi:hypothetical protein